MPSNLHGKIAPVLLAIGALCCPDAAATARKDGEIKPPDAPPVGRPKAGVRPRKAPSVPFAAVDMVRIFAEYQRAKDLSAQFKKAHEEIQAERDSRFEEIKQLKSKAEAAAGGEEAAKLKAQLQGKMIALDTWLKVKQADHLNEHKKLTQEMYGEAMQAIEQVSRRRGFLLVLNALPEPRGASNAPELVREIRGRAVLFADPRVDITDQVLEALNEAYRKKGQGKQLPPKAVDEM